MVSLRAIMQSVQVDFQKKLGRSLASYCVFTDFPPNKSVGYFY